MATSRTSAFSGSSTCSRNHRGKGCGLVWKRWWRNLRGRRFEASWYWRSRRYPRSVMSCTVASGTAPHVAATTDSIIADHLPCGRELVVCPDSFEVPAGRRTSHGRVMERPGGASTIGATNSREEAEPPHPDVSAALWWFDRRSGAGQTGGGLRTGVVMRILGMNRTRVVLRL